MKRSCGILLPVSALPSPYGIGTLGKEAYDFVDFLHEARQSWWQMLPVGPTSYGDSPYQSCSAFAGNPYFIDLDILTDEGLLTQSDINISDRPYNVCRVEYDRMYSERFRILRAAYSRFVPNEDYDRFTVENKFWLDDYALFMAIKDSFGGKPLSDWGDDIRMRIPEAVSRYASMLSENADFYKFMQYEFFKQWFELKKYANENGIQLISQ